MRLFSWNVNGFRAITQKPDWAWFSRCNGDIIGLQETKASPEQIDSKHLSPDGYHSYWVSSTVKKGYSGVATFSRMQPLTTTFELPDTDFQGEGRLIHLEMPQFHYFTVYFPNGQMSEERLNYKLGYYKAFLTFAEELRKTKPIIVCGDFNTAHRAIDLARPKANEETSGFLPIEREWLDTFVSAGYTDTFRHVHGDITDRYSWWSYRFNARKNNVGWRIDYFFVSDELKPAIKDAWIEDDVTGSDHCPIGLELAL